MGNATCYLCPAMQHEVGERKGTSAAASSLALASENALPVMVSPVAPAALVTNSQTDQCMALAQDQDRDVRSKYTKTSLRTAPD